MDRFDRIYALHSELRKARRPVEGKVLCERLKCSRATLMRTMDALRDTLHAPLEYDRGCNGYYYNPQGERPFELPGLWFNPGELYGLLSAQQLLEDIQPGLFEAELGPLRQRLEDLLAKQQLGSGELPRRVRIIKAAIRPVSEQTFQAVASGLVQRKRLHLTYRDRSSEQTTERDVSPQRLVHYRDNWYLDAWCHLRTELRTFSLDRIQSVAAMPQAADEIDDTQLDDHYTRTYGIFAGPVHDIAILRFTPQSARWVADEHWHPDQQGAWQSDGSYELRVPYGDPRELIMDILKYGPEVEVVGPEGLRIEVYGRLSKTVENYKESR